MAASAWRNGCAGWGARVGVVVFGATAVGAASTISVAAGACETADDAGPSAAWGAAAATAAGLTSGILEGVVPVAAVSVTLGSAGASAVSMAVADVVSTGAVPTGVVVVADANASAKSR